MADTRLAVEPSEARANVRFVPKTWEILTREADRRHMSVPGLVRQLVLERLDQMELLD